jgi:hypothetical protein
MSELYLDLPTISDFRPSPRGWITRHGLEEEWIKIVGPKRALVFEISLRTGSFMASVLRGDPQSAARTLVMPLVRVITMGKATTRYPRPHLEGRDIARVVPQADRNG